MLCGAITLMAIYMSIGGNFTKSDVLLKFIEEVGGRIKLEDIHKSHYTSLGNLFVDNLVRYADEEGKEIVETKYGKEYLEVKKKHYPKAFEKLKL